MIKLYRRLRKWWVIRNHRLAPLCRECVEEARADCGVYYFNESVSPNRKQEFFKAYDDKYYFAHLDPWGYQAKVRVR